MAELLQKHNGQFRQILGGVRNALLIKYNNLISGLTSTNVQNAIDEINTKVVNIEDGVGNVAQLPTPTKDVVENIVDISTNLVNYENTINTKLSVFKNVFYGSVNGTSNITIEQNAVYVVFVGYYDYGMYIVSNPTTATGHECITTLKAKDGAILSLTSATNLKITTNSGFWCNIYQIR